MSPRLYEILVGSSAGVKPATTPLAARRERGVALHIGQMASVAVSSATIIAIAAAAFLGYFLTISTLTLFGLMVIIWDGVMFVSSLMIMIAVRRHNRERPQGARERTNSRGF
jgi:hypothetical protein